MANTLYVRSRQFKCGTPSFMLMFIIRISKKSVASYGKEQGLSAFAYDRDKHLIHMETTGVTDEESDRIMYEVIDNLTRLHTKVIEKFQNIPKEKRNALYAHLKTDDKITALLGM